MQFEYQQAQLEAEVENLSWKVERAEITDRGVSHSALFVCDCYVCDYGNATRTALNSCLSLNPETVNKVELKTKQKLTSKHEKR